MEEPRIACGCPGCRVWFTSEAARTAHHAVAHNPEDVPATVLDPTDVPDDPPDPAEVTGG